MLTEVELQAARPGALNHAAALLGETYPGLPVRRSRPSSAIDGRAIGRRGPAVVVPARFWGAPAFDPTWLDDAVAAARRDGGYSLCVVDDPEGRTDLVLAAVQVVTRCQRHWGGRNRHSQGPLFAEALALHRSLHDLSRPLVAADYDHALDTWRWTLRLEPDASLAAQLAALFHDIERLVSESVTRVEQHASDYGAFKQAHAAAGAEMTRAALARIGADAALAERVAELVATHERPERDPEKLLLNEADALSFFSLNACGFARYYGPAHTRKKVAYTLARLGVRGRRALAGVRLRGDIAALVASLRGDA